MVLWWRPLPLLSVYYVLSIALCMHCLIQTSKSFWVHAGWRPRNRFTCPESSDDKLTFHLDHPLLPGKYHWHLNFRDPLHWEKGEGIKYNLVTTGFNVDFQISYTLCRNLQLCGCSLTTLNRPESSLTIGHDILLSQELPWQQIVTLVMDYTHHTDGETKNQGRMIVWRIGLEPWGPHQNWPRASFPGCSRGTFRGEDII